LGIGKDTEKGVEVRVHPTFVKNDNPLASVNDSFNAVHLVGDAVGEIMLYGRGAGALPTGSAIVSDVIFAAKHDRYFYANFENNQKGNKETKFVDDFTSKYYLRLSVADKPGVLSKISGVFAKNNVSILEVKQVAVSDEKAQIIIITHVCHESLVKKTLAKLDSLEEVFEVQGTIRIED
jgi:homoserine dehydrogenase